MENGNPMRTGSKEMQRFMDYVQTRPELQTPLPSCDPWEPTTESESPPKLFAVPWLSVMHWLALASCLVLMTELGLLLVLIIRLLHEH